MREFNVETTRRTQAVNVTAEVQEALSGAAADAAAAVVYVPHTSAGVVIQEHADPAVGTDLEMAFERIVDSDWPWEHLEEDDLNPWSHARAALTASSVVIPMCEGALALGTWQGIFFCEFDGPRTRTVYVATLA